MSLFRGTTRNRYLLLGDILLAVLSYAFTLLVVFKNEVFWDMAILNASAVLYTLVSFIGSMMIFNCYRVYWEFGSTREYVKLVSACIAATVISCCLVIFLPVGEFYFKAQLLLSTVLTMSILALRMSLRAIWKMVCIRNKKKNEDTKSVIIIGAGVLGVTLANDIKTSNDYSYNVLGFIDDDPAKKHNIISGYRVLGPMSRIGSICERFKPDEVIIAISSVGAEKRKAIIDACAGTKCKVRIMPGLAYTLSDKKDINFVRDVEVEDLLERGPVNLDNSGISKDLKDEVVMVTGGAGSIGSELCRQIMRFSPKKLVVVDIYENTTFELENHLRDCYPERDMDFVITSVRDSARLEQVFDKYRPHIVFHAAAHKHVPLMENNAVEAIKNNVFGTYNVACCADKYKVKRFVLISTDKAVNPTNVMGATKRVCEMIIQAMQKVSETEFVAVRFGNVLNSNGSVLPRFREQLKNGGPLTVTHPEITRFFMTISEAAQLVLQAGTYAKGGEIFVLDMGQPVKIRDLAENLIRLSGLKVGKDIKIEYVGLRPGEKLYEELLMDEEGLQKTGHDKIFIAKPFFDSYEELQKKLAILKDAIAIGTNEAIKDAVEEVVPTYIRESEKVNKLPEQKADGEVMDICSEVVK